MSRTSGTVRPLFANVNTRHPLPRFRSVGVEVQRSTVGGGWVALCIADDAGWASYIALSLTFATDPCSPLHSHDLATAE